MSYFHVWFSTKGRKPALVDEIAETAGGLLRDIAMRRGIDIVEMELAFDHVHLLIATTQNQTLSDILHDLKGATAREIFRIYPELRLDMGSNSFWQKGFGWRLVPEDEIETVRRYIRTHIDRPLRHE